LTSDLEEFWLTFFDVTLTFFTGVVSLVGPVFPEEAVVGLMKAGTDLPRAELLLLVVVLPVDFLIPTDSCLGGEDRKLEDLSTRGAFEVAVRVVVLRTVLLLPALLFPELERDKFSFELPESPRFTLTVELGVLLCVLASDLFELLKLRVRLSEDWTDLGWDGARGLLLGLFRELEAGDGRVLTVDDLVGPTMGGARADCDLRTFVVVVVRPADPSLRRPDPSLDCLLRDPVERKESVRESGREGVTGPELWREPDDLVLSPEKGGSDLSA